MCQRRTRFFRASRRLKWHTHIDKRTTERRGECCGRATAVGGVPGQSQPRSMQLRPLFIGCLKPASWKSLLQDSWLTGKERSFLSKMDYYSSAVAERKKTLLDCETTEKEDALTAVGKESNEGNNSESPTSRGK